MYEKNTISNNYVIEIDTNITLRKVLEILLRNIVKEIKLYRQFITSVWNKEQTVNNIRIPIEWINNYLKYPASKDDVLKALDRIKVSAEVKLWVKDNLPDSVYYSQFPIMLSLNSSLGDYWLL